MKLFAIFVCYSSASHLTSVPQQRRGDGREIGSVAKQRPHLCKHGQNLKLANEKNDDVIATITGDCVVVQYIDAVTHDACQS